VSVQGACLTVTRKDKTRFYADVSRETMAKTTLGDLSPGSRVNLEPSPGAPGDALGRPLGERPCRYGGQASRPLVQDWRVSWRLEFELPASLMRFVAPKGSICVNGVRPDGQQGGRPAAFDVNIIPHTLQGFTPRLGRA